MESLKGSSGRSRDVFAEATHGKDEINSCDIAKIEKAAVSRSV